MTEQQIEKIGMRLLGTFMFCVGAVLVSATAIAVIMAIKFAVRLIAG